MQNTTKYTITLYYDAFGDVKNEAVILIPGLGAHAISWADKFCQMIADADFYVLRIDNRDVGLSTHLKDTPSFDLTTEIGKLQQGQPSLIPYSLFDMAKDMIKLLAQLDLPKAHIVDDPWAASLHNWSQQ